MRIVVVILNAVLFFFMSFILMTEGPPNPGADTVSVLLSVLTKVSSGLMILLTVDGGRFIGFYARFRALFRQGRISASIFSISNLITLVMVGEIVGVGFVCWHLTSQLNHPDEPGVIPFAILQVLTPIINVLVLSRSVQKNTESHE